MSTEQPISNRYRGLGGFYVVVDGDTWPADEAGNPLPHTLDETGAPMRIEPVPSAPTPPTAPADAEPQE